MASSNKAETGLSDDQYKTATKAVIDDALRTDLLGPRVCAVLTEHTPASKKIRELIAEAIIQEPAVKSAVEGVVESLDTKRKSRWIDRLIGGLGGLVLAILTGVIVFAVTHLGSL